jgi:hypothetical protein
MSRERGKIRSNCTESVRERDGGKEAYDPGLTSPVLFLILLMTFLEE